MKVYHLATPSHMRQCIRFQYFLDIYGVNWQSAFAATQVSHLKATSCFQLIVAQGPQPPPSSFVCCELSLVSVVFINFPFVFYSSCTYVRRFISTFFIRWFRWCSSTFCFSLHAPMYEDSFQRFRHFDKNIQQRHYINTVKFCNTTSSLLRFENKTKLFYFQTL
jgi:hypothetical protein